MIWFLSSPAILQNLNNKARESTNLNFPRVYMPDDSLKQALNKWSGRKHLSGYWVKPSLVV